MFQVIPKKKTIVTSTSFIEGINNGDNSNDNQDNLVKKVEDLEMYDSNVKSKSNEIITQN